MANDYAELNDSQEKKDPDIRKGRFNLVLFIFAILLILVANYVLYYYFIVPFGLIYGISRWIQKFLLIVFILISFVVLI